MIRSTTDSPSPTSRPPSPLHPHPHPQSIPHLSLTLPSRISSPTPPLTSRPTTPSTSRPTTPSSTTPSQTNTPARLTRTQTYTNETCPFKPCTQQFPRFRNTYLKRHISTQHKHWSAQTCPLCTHKLDEYINIEEAYDEHIRKHLFVGRGEEELECAVGEDDGDDNVTAEQPEMQAASSAAPTTVNSEATNNSRKRKRKQTASVAIDSQGTPREIPKKQADVRISHRDTTYPMTFKSLIGSAYTYQNPLTLANKAGNVDAFIQRSINQYSDTKDVRYNLSPPNPTNIESHSTQSHAETQLNAKSQNHVLLEDVMLSPLPPRKITFQNNNVIAHPMTSESVFFNPAGRPLVKTKLHAQLEDPCISEALIHPSCTSPLLHAIQFTAQQHKTRRRPISETNTQAQEEINLENISHVFDASALDAIAIIIDIEADRLMAKCTNQSTDVESEGLATDTEFELAE